MRGRRSLSATRLYATSKLEKLYLKSLEFPNQRFDLLRRIFDVLGLALTPSRPAADRNGQRSSIEAPSFTVSKEVAPITRTDSIR